MKRVGKICVIGAGRIGLPISVSLASSGQEVVILEIDSEKCDMINDAQSPFFEIDMDKELEKAVSAGLIVASTDKDVLSGCNVFISAIGTGISEDGTPDVSGIDDLIEVIAPSYNKGDLLLLKTTLPIGTTELIAKKISEKTGLSLDTEALVAFSPERIVEGRAMEELRTLPKIVGGVGPNSTEMAKEVMAKFGGSVVEVSDTKTAEMCKLIDNSYRMTRFGFSADIAVVSAMNGIDAFEAINAANREYGRNNVPLPSIGVSGYCLTKDPYYLDIGGSDVWTERGFHSTWISARKAADFQMTMAVEKISGFLSRLENNPVIVIAGATYKEDVDDCRLSHGRDLAQLLSSIGFEIIFWDPMIEDEILDGFPVFKEKECIANTDCLIFTVPHTDFREWAIEMPCIDRMRTKYIFDGWGIVRNVPEGVIVHGTGKPNHR